MDTPEKRGVARAEAAMASVKVGLGRYIPHHCRDGVHEYILRGRATGHFLTAVFSNDLMGAFRRADSDNQRAMLDYAMFLENHAPTGCYGSKKTFDAWLAQGGLIGEYVLMEKAAHFYKAIWPEEDQNAGFKLGFVISNGGTVGQKIERIDAPSEHGFSLPDEPIFKSDLDAMNYVIAKAYAGDELCLKALRAVSLFGEDAETASNALAEIEQKFPRQAG